jgi:hypothetical protein
MLHCRKIFNIHLSFTVGSKMNRDQVVGAGILLISAVIIIAYRCTKIQIEEILKTSTLAIQDSGWKPLKDELSR